MYKMKAKKKKHMGKKAAVFPLYLFTTVFVLVPLIYMVVLSFLTKGEVWGVVGEVTLDNYKKIIEPVYLKTFVESIKLALISTFFVMLLGYPCGYFMAKLGEIGQKRMMVLIGLPFLTNSLLRLFGWVIVFRSNGLLDKLLMAIGLTEKPLKLLYSYPAVVVGMIYALLPFMILSVYSGAEKMDWSVVEAARDLGASRLRAFWTVTFPMTLPGLLSGVVLTFVPTMGLFFIADILGGNKVVLIGSVIYTAMTKERDWPFAAALAVVLMLLTSLMLYLSRRFSKVNDR